ncbi:MAG TPA: HAD family phosphatase [Jatrophihabitans sp.]|nr:HAD family phosphatase [Jatrophihabitans sp.]
MDDQRVRLGPVRAVIFDLDGVLIDSEGLWDEVRRDLAARHGLPWPQAATRAMMGMSTREWSTYLADEVGVPGTPEQLAEEVIDAMAERYRASLPLIPGAQEAVARLAPRWRLGLASSSPRRLIDTVLDAADITSLFEFTVSTEEVEGGKPSPAVYLEVVRRLGVPAPETAAIEDSTNGLRAAHAAGLAVVALPHAAFPPSTEALGLADARIDNLAEVTPELIESLRR